MMRALALLLPFAVLACSSGRPPAPPPSAAEQACIAQSDSDPALEQARAISAGSLAWQWDHGPQIEQIKRDAVTKCLRARGLMSRGGVERPR